MITVDWQNITPEQYLTAGLLLLVFVLLILWMRAGSRYRRLKRKQVADEIEMETTGQTDRWFRVFTRTIPQVFWIRSQQETLYVSPHFEQLTGHPESVMNHFPHGLLQLAHPDDRQQTEEAHRLFLEHPGSQLDHIFRLRKSGSHYIWIRERLFAYTHTSGEKYQVGLIEDVTDQQMAREETRDQKVLLDNILETNDEGIFCLDRQFSCIFWNREMENMSGMSREQVVGKPDFFKVFPHLEENGAADAIRKTLQGETPPPERYSYQLPTRRKGYTIDKYFPLRNARNEIIGVLGIVQDITEEVAREAILEKTQERYGLTLRALNDGLWDWDMASDDFIFSDRWFDMLGYTPDELSSSLTTLKECMESDEDRCRIENALATLRQGEAIATEVRMRTKTGESRWMLIRGDVTERDDSGHPVRALGTQSDITRRKENEIKLRKALKRAEESDHLKSAFLANMSHEIRTPLNAIVGFTDLLSTSDDLQSDEVAHFQHQIRDNADHLLGLIDDIVLLSMLEAGQMKLSLSETGLLNLIRETAQKVYKQFGKNKASAVRLSVQAPPDLKDLTLLTDPTLLQKCLANLIENGLAYTRQGQVTAGFKIHDAGGLCIYVSDTGTGIHPDDQGKLFRHFTQLENGLNRTTRGTGLGLSLVKVIVQELGGTIQVESEPDKGSTFCITLPYQTPSEKL